MRDCHIVVQPFLLFRDLFQREDSDECGPRNADTLINVSPLSIYIDFLLNESRYYISKSF